LAFFAFQTLPVNYAGIILIFLAIIFFIMEMKIPSYGLLSIAGIVSLFLGSIMLFNEDSGQRISLQVFLPTLLVISGFFVIIAGLVFKAQVSRPKTGGTGLIGEIGIVKKEILREGKVFVHGELWNAKAGKQIPEGISVRVTGVSGLVLEVETVEPYPGENTDKGQEVT